MRRQLKLRRVTITITAHFRTARKRRTKRDRHVRSSDDRGALRVFKTENKLRRSDAGRFVELPLKHSATLNARLLRVNSLSFAERELIGNITRQISKSRQYDRNLQ